MDISLIHKNKSQAVFPIRRTTLPKCDIDIISLKPSVAKYPKHISQTIEVKAKVIEP